MRFLACFIVGLICVAPTRNLLAADASGQRQEYARRLSRLQSLFVTFFQQTNHTPPAELIDAYKESAAKTGARLKILTGVYVERGRFDFLEGRALYDISYADETVHRLEAEGTPFLRRKVNAYSLDRAESFAFHSQTGHAAGAIVDNQRLPDDYPVDIGLGLRYGLEQRWLDDAALGRAVFATTPDGRTTMELESSKHPDVRYRWQLDPSAGGAVVAFQARKGAFTFCEVTCSDFAERSGVMLPSTIVRVDWSSPSHVTQTTSVKVERCVLGSRLNVPDHYHIEYPSGSLVRDMRLDVPLRAATTRPFSDRDVYLAAVKRDSISRPIPSRPAIRWWLLGAACAFVAFAFLAHRRLRPRHGGS